MATTRTAAELLGVLDDRGTVEPGKRADLVLVDGDPLDVDTIGDRIVSVYQDGKLVTSTRCDVREQVVERAERFELRELGADVVGRTEQQAHVGLGEHRGVVVESPAATDSIVEALERAHGVVLVIGHPQAVADDATAVDDEPVTHHGRATELGEERPCELLERVGEDDDLGDVAAGRESRRHRPAAPGRRSHR